MRAAKAHEMGDSHCRAANDNRARSASEGAAMSGCATIQQHRIIRGFAPYVLTRRDYCGCPIFTSSLLLSFHYSAVVKPGGRYKISRLRQLPVHIGYP
jgi:hypothetical protein